MSAAEFQTALDPKVRGSWNLHSLLPKDMDFFILLSSLTGVIGMGGQANYASGNTYQDALARHRISIGEKAVSIDLGMMLDVGFVAQSKSIQDSMNAKGFFMGVTELELHALLARYCDPACPLLSPTQSQVVTGIEVPATLRAKQIEEPYWMRKPLFRMLYQFGLGADADVTAADNLLPANFQPLVRGRDFADRDCRFGHVDAITRKLARTLGTAVEDIDTARPMHYYGVDSLVAVELRNWFVRDMGADLAIFDILGGASISALSLVVASRTKFRGAHIGRDSIGEEEGA